MLIRIFDSRYFNPSQIRWLEIALYVGSSEIAGTMIYFGPSKHSANPDNILIKDKSPDEVAAEINRAVISAIDGVQVDEQN